MIMKIIPFMLPVFSFAFPTALIFYYLTSNIELINNRLVPNPMECRSTIGIFNENDSFGIPYLGKNVKFFGGNLFSSNEYNLISGISTGGIYLLSEDLCIHGDLNQNELVNISDILILIDLIIESQTRNAYLKCAGDLNNDFGFNILDIAGLVHLILN